MNMTRETTRRTYRFTVTDRKGRVVHTFTITTHAAELALHLARRAYPHGTLEMEAVD